jgi:hypothetical protein
MKLSRRTLITGLTTAAIYAAINRVQLLKAESVLGVTESNQVGNWLQNGQLNQEQLYQYFLQLAAGGKEDHPVLLYQGIERSPYQNQIPDYPMRLSNKPDNQSLVSGLKADASFNPYTTIGKLPNIDEEGLKFLHPDIQEACVCLGSFSEGELKTKWLGRNALITGEFWSSTKIIPLVYQIELEKWVKNITGNENVVFRGRYGENPFIDQPELIYSTTGELLVPADTNPPRWACNEVSAYDLTRIISLIGWHNYLPASAQIPGLRWDSLETLIQALGTDPARLTDLAIKVLGLENDLDSVVILSKLGNGATGTRERTEAIYLALIQFIDRRSQPAQQITLSMALRGGLSRHPRNLDQEVVDLDARMATEVTGILWRVVLGSYIL